MADDIALREAQVFHSFSLRGGTSLSIDAGVLADVAQLRQTAGDLKGMTGSPTAETAGTLARGDGGAGTFVWDPLSTKADDGGVTLSVGGVSVGRWRRQLSGAIDIRFYGADPTGVRDSTAALQAAIDAAGEGGAVRIPCGKFRIVGSVTVRTGQITIYGEGRSSILYWPGGQVAAGQAPYEQKMQIYASNVEMYGFRWLGDNGDSTGAGFVHATGSQEDMLSSAIAVGGGTTPAPNHDIYLHDLFFENLFGFGIQSGNGTPSSHLERVAVTRCSHAFNGNGLNISADYLIISDCHLFNSEGVETLGYKTILTHCHVWGGFTGGITMYGDSAMCGFNLVDASSVTNTSTGFNNAPSCFQFPGLRYSTIVGNTVINPGGHAYQFNPDPTPGSTRFPKFISFVGNSVRSTRTVDANASGPTELIFITGSEDIAIVGVALSGVVGSFSTVIGIGVFGSKRVVITGGSVANVSNAGIDFESASQDCAVIGTALSNCGLVGVAIQTGCTRIYVDGLQAFGAAVTDIRVDVGASFVRLGDNNVATQTADPAATYRNRIGRDPTNMGNPIAASSTLALGPDGLSWLITGNGTINYIATTGWRAGARVALVFTGAPTVNHNAGSVPASTAPVLLSGNANVTYVANTVLALIYDGTRWIDEKRIA